MPIFENICETIGKTPIIKLSKTGFPAKPDCAQILGKLESFNPAASVKDRIALAMITDAIKRGALKPGQTIIEPTSGNTGIGLAMVAAVMGYKLILVMPESMSLERRKILKSYGAQLVLTPPEKGMRGAVEEATRLCKENKYFMPQQFDNPANPEIHRKTTAQEIIADTHLNFDAFISGVGTGGTLTGVGSVIKKLKPDIKIIAVEPQASPVLSGGKPSPHKIQGIGAGFVPSILDTSLMDEIIQVSNENAMLTARELAQNEGVFAGISSGAATWAAIQVAKRLGKGKTVLVILPDTGERYLTTDTYHFEI